MDSRSPRKPRRATPPPRSFIPRPNLHPTGGLLRDCPARLLLFAAQHTPHKILLQVLFLRSVLRTNQVVLDLLCHSALAPTVAGAVSSIFAAAVRRVRGVSRLNCLIL